MSAPLSAEMGGSEYQIRRITERLPWTEDANDLI